MILNLSDLKDYADALAKRVPGIAHRVTIKEPGISADDLSKFLAGMCLPPIYVRCISALNLFGVAIGYFSVWPGSIKAGNMVEALLRANQGDYLGAHEARESTLVVVAQEESNLICVGQADSDLPDTVYLLDVMRSPKIERMEVAPDFEKFLLLAGNLHDIGRKYEGNISAGMAEMLDCCQHFACTNNQISFWTSRVETVVS
ncbi:MAG: hypothetical protein ABIT70_01105 [Sulfuriferula sp.]